MRITSTFGASKPVVKTPIHARLHGRVRATGHITRRAAQNKRRVVAVLVGPRERMLPFGLPAGRLRFADTIIDAEAFAPTATATASGESTGCAPFPLPAIE